MIVGGANLVAFDMSKLAFDHVRMKSMFIQDRAGRGTETGLKNRWTSRDFVNSPDPRFRKIVRRFADAGFPESERDEFSAR